MLLMRCGLKLFFLTFACNSQVITVRKIIISTLTSLRTGVGLTIIPCHMFILQRHKKKIRINVLSIYNLQNRGFYYFPLRTEYQLCHTGNRAFSHGGHSHKILKKID